MVQFNINNQSGFQMKKTRHPSRHPAPYFFNPACHSPNATEFLSSMHHFLLHARKSTMHVTVFSLLLKHYRAAHLAPRLLFSLSSAESIHRMSEWSFRDVNIAHFLPEKTHSHSFAIKNPEFSCDFCALTAPFACSVPAYPDPIFSSVMVTPLLQ